MRPTAKNTRALLLTTQERLALLIALKTTLRLWGDSEDQAQERVRGKLESILTKLDALDENANPPSPLFTCAWF
jgi:hypothetical protein